MNELTKNINKIDAILKAFYNSKKDIFLFLFYYLNLWYLINLFRAIATVNEKQI